MKIKVKKSTVVRPAEATPTTSLWLSKLDVLMYPNYHVRVTTFFRSNGAENFFDPVVLKEALGRALVHFYPMAGRLKGDNGHVEVDCNSEGVLFVEAESDGTMDELGDFDPRPDLSLVPAVDYSKGLSAYPIFLVQVTRFKCGGVCLGTASEHQVVDGNSSLHFMKSWSEIARGIDITLPPFLDRRAVLSARNPPQPKFAHDEYQPPPSLELPPDPETRIFKKFKLSRDQMNALKEQCKDDDPNLRYTTYEVLAVHAWRCATIARGLPADQETLLQIPIDGRTRLQPPLPSGYFGNSIFHATITLQAGELQSNLPKFLVPKIHATITRRDNDYLRSAIDYLELHPDLSSVSRDVNTLTCPSFCVNNWARLPLCDLDFGWGRPTYAGHAAVPAEGKSYILGTNIDGSVSYGISLPREHMGHFGILFHDI